MDNIVIYTIYTIDDLYKVYWEKKKPYDTWNWGLLYFKDLITELNYKNLSYKLIKCDNEEETALYINNIYIDVSGLSDCEYTGSICRYFEKLNYYITPPPQENGYTLYITRKRCMNCCEAIKIIKQESITLKFNYKIFYYKNKYDGIELFLNGNLIAKNIYEM